MSLLVTITMPQIKNFYFGKWALEMKLKEFTVFKNKDIDEWICTKSVQNYTHINYFLTGANQLELQKS